MFGFKESKTQEEQVQFPTTQEGLDAFVAKIVTKYNLPNTDDTYDNIATMIMHVPASCCKAPLSYFGESVLKSMANKVAFDKLKEFRDKRDKAMKQAAAPAQQPDMSKKLFQTPMQPDMSKKLTIVQPPAPGNTGNTGPDQPAS